MGGAQSLDSSRSSSQPNPLLRETLWDPGSGFEGGFLVGCHGRSCGESLTSILSLVPSSRFPLIQATLCKAFRVRSSLPEEECQRADSMKNLGAEVRGGADTASVPVRWEGEGCGGGASQGPAVRFHLRLGTLGFCQIPPAWTTKQCPA